MWKTRHFVEREDGEVVKLLRVRWEAGGLHGEYFDDGAWIAHGAVPAVLTDPGDAEEIDEEEAWAIARSLAPPVGCTLDGGRVRVIERVAGGPDRGLYRGLARDDQGSVRRVLVTVALAQRVPLAEVRARLGYEVPGVPRLGYLGPIDTGEEARRDALVEDEPEGAPVTRGLDGPMPAARAARILLDASAVVEAAHARGVVLLGLRPELLYVRADARGEPAFTGLTARPEVFFTTAGQACYGIPRAFADCYLSPEVIKLAKIGPASDVFSLGAMLARLATAAHPFAGTDGAQILSIAAGSRRPFAGDAALGKLLDEALAPSPEARPSLDAWTAALRALAGAPG